MKKSFSKRILSVLLSVLMIVTTIPAFTITAQAATLQRDPSYNKYLYVYFSGNQGCQVRFAVSDDGYNFEALNSGEQILQTATDDIITFNGKTGMGNQKGARDPFIVRKHDNSGFYIIATDLDTSYGKSPDGKNNQYNNTNILVWECTSLDKAGEVKPWSLDLSGWYPSYFGTGNSYFNKNGVNTSFCSWAPEAIWDAEKGKYMMFWSGPMYNDLRVRYAYTSDFKTFFKADGTVLDGTTGEPDTLYDNGRTSIDGNINYDSDTGKYYMYFKDEQSVRDGNAVSNLIRRVEADHLSGPYKNEIKIDTAGVGLEGPEVYQALDGDWVLMGDNFATDTSGGYFTFYKSANIADLKGGSDQYFGDGLTINHLVPSHGAMFYINTEEYNALIGKYGISNFDTPALEDIKTVNDNLVARYFTTGDVKEDATGHNYTLTTANNIEVQSDDERSSYAEFTGGNYLATQYQHASYGAVDTTKMLNDYNFNANDGVTFSWYANNKMTNADGTGFAAYFSQAQSGVLPGSLTYNENGSHFNTSHTFAYAGKPTFSAGGQGIGQTVYGSKNTLDPPSLYTNGWHEFTVTYVNGFMNFFIDGKIYNTFLTEAGERRTGSPLKVTSINDQWFKDIFTGNLYFGASLFNGSDQMFTGSISDFRIYNKALNPEEVAASERYLLAEELGEAVTAFENKLSSDKILKNYSEAYKAYIECKKALDALNYGTMESGQLDEQIDYDALIDTLVDFSKSVTKFNTIKTKQVFDSNNENLPINEKYANKLLHYGGSMSFNNNLVGDIRYGGGSTTWGTSYQFNFKLIMSDYVMLYDGDENLPTAPVQVVYEYGHALTGTDKRGIVSGICENKELNLAVWREAQDVNKSGQWRLTGDSAPFLYADGAKYTLRNVAYTGTLGDNADGIIHIGKHTKKDEKWTGDSYVTLNPANVTFNTNNDAYQIVTSISIYDQGNVRQNFTPTKATTDGVQWSKYDSLKYRYDYTDHPTNDNRFNTNYGYVVNYVPVKQAQERALTYIQNVKDYQLDNVNYLALLQAVDESTSLDFVTMFDNTSNIQKTANEAGHMIKSAADKIDAAIAKLEAEHIKVDNYQTLRESITDAKIIANATNTTYTDASFAEFKKIFADAQALMNDVYGTNATHTYENNNYNHNDKAAAIADALNNVLNDLMDVTELRTTLETKASIYNDKGEQVSTLSSWLANKDKIQKGQTDLVTLGKAPKYNTTEDEYLPINSSVPVKYQRVDKTSLNTQPLDDAIKSVQKIKLDPVDAADAYNNFDNVCEVVNAMDTAKYTEDALAEIKTLYNKLNNEVVYATPSDEAAQLYKAINGVDISREVLKNTTTDKTDPETIRLLELVNGAAVNQYTAYLSVKVENGTESAFTQYGEIKPYGDMFTIDVADKVQDGDKVTWSALLYKKGDGAKAVAGEKVEPIGTQKISNYTGSVLQRKADCDFVVTAKITKKNPSASEKIVKIYNGYGNLLDVKYVASEEDVKVNGTELFVGTETIGEPKLPFYTLKGWKVSPAGDTIYVNPVYNTVELKTITFNGGTAEGLNGDKAAVTNYVTLTADDANAYGWAIKNGDKYQIVGYGNVYSFLVVNDETYYPIIKAADGSYTVNGEVLTAAMVEGFQNNTANKMSDDDFLKVKLDNKAPFVYNQSANGRTHYYRITANCSEAVLKAHGMLVTKPDGNGGTASARFDSTTQNVGGQYSMTMKKDTAGYTFSGYIAYEFTYEFKGKEYKLNTAEYTAPVNS